VADALRIAASGLQAASTALEVSAHNLANSRTAGFRPLAVSLQQRAGGGVDARVLPPDEARAAADHHHLLAELSGTDLGQEVVGQLASAAAFRANLVTLRTAQENSRSLLDLLA
jgi:flagellar hook protein FlgE